MIPLDIFSFIQDHSTKQRGITYFCHLGLSSTPKEKTHCMRIWENDSTQTFHKLQWFNASNNILKHSRYTTHWESQLKRASTTLRRTYPNCFCLIPHCWRNCGEQGTLLQIWWQYPKIYPFLVSVFQFISSLISLKLELDPAMALLLLNYEHLAKSHLLFIIHCMVAARKSIASNLNTQTQFKLMFSIKNGIG